MLNNNTNVKKTLDDDLLARYLAQEATSDEISQVEMWLAASPTHQHELDAFRTIWERTSTLKESLDVDTDTAWERIKRRMEHPETVIRPLHQPKRSKKLVWQLAASVVILLGISAVLYRFLFPHASEQKTLATQQFHLEQRLPDGTLVYLNANSQLNYPSDFEGDTREVTLKGEAFFHVKPDASKPFLIDANGTTVRVLGTSFNVRAYDQNVSVEVETGKVSFSAKKKQVILAKGEGASFEAKSDTILKINHPSKNVLAYKTKLFLFEQTPLQEVIQLLNEAYQSKISLKTKRLQNCKLTANFNNEDVETILAIIAETFSLQVERADGQIILDGNGCQ